MRYKFRGQRVDTQEWIYGYLLHIDGKPFIFEFGARISHSAHYGEQGHFGILSSGDADSVIGFESKRISEKWLCEVLPETVGQWTGLKDKKDSEVYHKDILSSGKKLFIVEWQKEEARFLLLPYGQNTDSWKFMDECDHMEIIGSIHTHPDLFSQFKDSPIFKPAKSNDKNEF